MAIIKTPFEIETMKRAAAAAEAVFALIIPFVRPGATETSIAKRLERLAKGVCGYTALSFPPIVAAGPNGAGPHAVPTRRGIKEGDLVTIDFGVSIEGYASDMTRTFFIGGAGGESPPKTPTERQKEIHALVLKAQLAGINAARPGIICKDLDRVCRSIIEAAGYGESFKHTTGHGVGTEVHEDPRIGKESEAVLEPGMIVTIEPGIYIENWGGVRIEDTILITETGSENLTPNIPKTLVI